MSALVLRFLSLLLGFGLLVLGFELPNPTRIEESFLGIHKIGSGTEDQLDSFQQQISSLRQSDWQETTRKLREQTAVYADIITKQPLDFEQLANLVKLLDESASSLRKFSTDVDAKQLENLAKAVGGFADFMEQTTKLANKEQQTKLETALAEMKVQQEQLKKLATTVPPSLATAKEVYGSLDKFELGIVKLKELFQEEQLDAMKDGMAGLESSLESTAKQVDSAGGYTYPVITIENFKPKVSTKPFWPDAPKVAEGLRQAQKGSQAGRAQIDAMKKNLPAVQTALDEGVKSLGLTKQSLKAVIDNQDSLEKAFQHTPTRLADLIESFGQIGNQIVRVMQAMKQLDAVSTTLRQSSKELKQTSEQFPLFLQSLSKSAAIMEQMKTQLQVVVDNRDKYSSALDSSSKLAEALHKSVTPIEERIDGRLAAQEESLAKVKSGLHDFNETLPVLGKQAKNTLFIIRGIIWVLAAMLILHALWSFQTARKVAKE
ncbi:MAG: hypothetical protein R3B84_10235 [Zavarzinella sp.]